MLSIDKMANVIHIQQPRIQSVNGIVKMMADISWYCNGVEINESVWFGVEERFGKYLTCEYSDPFILAMFEIAIENGFDILCDTPVSEDLIYNLETYLIPVFANKTKGLKPFKLLAKTSYNKADSEDVVATGFSGGIDSFYTVLKHINNPYSSKRITHLMLAVNGAAQTGINAELDQKWYKEEMTKFSSVADELGLSLIGINSNVSLLNHYRYLLKGGSGITTASFVFALRKLFGTYYWASTYEADVLQFRTDDLGFSEPFFLPLLSVKGLRFYHSGCETTRIGKMEYIADNALVQKTLTVCGHPSNCGICNKCTRTMAELYAIGKLEKYKGIFPEIDKYEKTLSKNLGREFAQDHAPFTTEIIKKMKENKKRIPIFVWIWKWCWFKPFFYFKKKLRYNKLFMKLYYEKGWLERLGEKRPPEERIKAKLAGERIEK